MIPMSHEISRSDNWSVPQPHTDPTMRLLKYGPIRAMDDDRGFFWRLFGRR